ncbi:MAG: isochorismatase family cysteine hydrolase [Campylobacterota bacterium]|nr:isochorismatase family cysteine hydrolase [Campylobacterota bacterium]
MNKALLIIDMLNDFILSGAPLEIPEARNIIPNVKKEIEEARKNKEYIIYVCDSHTEDDKEFKIWPKHAVRGTEGAKVVKELSPQKEDFIIEKTTYDGFYQTELESLLKQLNVDELTIVGCVSNICIMYTTSSAVLRGYKVNIPLNCIASIDEEGKDCALKQFKEVLKVNLI